MKFKHLEIGKNLNFNKKVYKIDQKFFTALLRDLWEGTEI